MDKDWVSGAVSRLWKKDLSLWPGKEKLLGWLDVAVETERALPAVERVASDLRKEKVRHVLVLGMGGSSLCPEVLRRSLPAGKDSPRLVVLDSTDPGTLRQTEKDLDLSRTLVVVSSKSGSTVELQALCRYFRSRIPDGKNFVAITDPGSPLESLARDEGFRDVFHGRPDVGGRFSALSPFGMFPAALAGLDSHTLLESALKMAAFCGANTPMQENPGAVLGAFLARAWEEGRDKLTLCIDPSISTLGLWIEQLVAESTGKEGKGVLPVVEETLRAPEAYGKDRAFVCIGNTPGRSTFLPALERAGHPVFRIEPVGPLDLGGEFFRWEFAIALLGHRMGINPFDQPDVQSAKDFTRRALEARIGLRESGLTPLGASGIEAVGDPGVPLEGSALECLRRHFLRARPGDYVALLAYLPATTQPALDRWREQIANSLRLPATLGFGPRYLHSTGQLHKGGSDLGLFLLLTAHPAEDVSNPTFGPSFGELEFAQACGDFQALLARKRRVLWIHVSGSVEASVEEWSRAPITSGK